MGDRLSSGCTAGARASLQRDGLFTMGHGIHTRVKTVTIRFSLAWLVSLALRSGLRGAENIIITALLDGEQAWTSNFYLKSFDMDSV